MNRDDIIRIAREAEVPFNKAIERFANLVSAAERNKLAQWMAKHSYATGHGDTIEDLLKELEWQIRESEREACIELTDSRCQCAWAIRARGQV
jgi:hypothetical protein